VFQVQQVGTFGTQLGSERAQPRKITTHGQMWYGWGNKARYGSLLAHA
jgi:hypothetical protein